MINMNQDRHCISHAIVVGSNVSRSWDTQLQLQAANIEIAAAIDPLAYGSEGIGAAVDSAVAATGALPVNILMVALDASINEVLDCLDSARRLALLWLVSEVDEVPIGPPPSYVRTWVVVAQQAAETWQHVFSSQVSPWNAVDTLWAGGEGVASAAGQVARLLRSWELARVSQPVFGTAAVVIKNCSIARNRVKIEATVSWEGGRYSKLPWSAWLRFQAVAGEYVDIPLTLKVTSENGSVMNGTVTTRHEIGIDVAQVPPGTYHLRLDVTSDAGRFVSGPLPVRLHCHSVFRLPLPTQPAWDTSVAMVGAGSLDLSHWNETGDARRWTKVCSSLSYVDSPVLHSQAMLERWTTGIFHAASASNASVIVVDALHLVDHRTTLLIQDPLGTMVKLLKSYGYQGTIIVPRLRISSKNVSPNSEFLTVVDELNEAIEKAERDCSVSSSIHWTEPVPVVVDETSCNRHDVTWAQFVDYGQLQRQVWRALQFHCEMSLSHGTLLR